MFIASLKALLFLFMVLLCLFLILIVLIQRGKGGGLVGAFGGMGGSSAFGGKTSDVFVKITVWTAIIWFVTCIGGRYVIDMNSHNSLLDQASGGAVTAPANPPADATPATDAAAPAASDAPTAEAEAAPATPAAPVTNEVPAEPVAPRSPSPTE